VRVCLICAEFFGWGGSGGGFGYATRVLGRELVKKGVEVYAVIPRPKNEPDNRAKFDGVTVIGTERTRPFSSGAVFNEINADIYHSQQPSLASYIAQRAMPDRPHLATLRDPRSPRDWWKEFSYPTHNRARVALTWAYYENPLARKAIRNMEGLFVPAHYLSSRAQALYGLVRPPGFLPTPVYAPKYVEKAKRPTVCFVGRWDRVKRPWRFFELSRVFPEVDFIAIGRAHNQEYERELREKYQSTANLEMVGYVDQFHSNALSEYLARSWMLVNTSAKEALPNTFLEACAHRCAIISQLNPDDFASRFGFHVQDDDYTGAIRYLLEENRWRQRGLDGYNYMLSNNELSMAADRHIEIYQDLLT
jgi:glycosyltransferase involved in cell wall biosynthesis